MQTRTHAVGIDLGTTFSCIAHLNEHGEPVTLANQEGELSTPSVVMYDGDEPVVGTEALRNAIVQPNEVIQHSKRYIGTNAKTWNIHGRKFTPVDAATLILKKLIGAAQEQIGVIEHAVVTVPAQFSDAQRNATIRAGLAAGLQKVDIINEPVAAALCYVLGSEGIWFDELADEQRILVYDLGGGTFDLSLVKYRKNEVAVEKSTGDLHLGGIDWSNALRDAIGKQFTSEFGADPRTDPESLQFLTNESEMAKRSLTIRPKAALTAQHGGHRKTYQVLREQFESICKPLVDRTAKITEELLRDHRGKVRWGQVDVVLTTGGSSRMPMVRERLNKMSGTTINTSLSPDQSIAHGAAYYAGMLLTNDKFARSILTDKAHQKLAQVKQRSVNARSLGIMVRDMKSKERVPHFLLPANTPLPAEFTNIYGTVKPNQRRVRLEIVESGARPELEPAVLGNCLIDDLPPNLPEGSRVAVRIRYDEQARVHVDAKEMSGGQVAHVEILRQENLQQQMQHFADDEVVDSAEVVKPPKQQERKPVAPKPRSVPQAKTAQKNNTSKKPKVRAAPLPKAVASQSGTNLEASNRPVPLCNECGEPMDSKGRCNSCGAVPRSTTKPKPRSLPDLPPLNDDDVIDLLEASGPPTSKPAASKPGAKRSAGQQRRQPASGKKSPPSGQQRRQQAPRRQRPQSGEDEFWNDK